MFELNPLHLPDAAWQLGIILLMTSVLGFIIGYVDRQKTIQRLRWQLDLLKQDVDQCLESSLPDDPALTKIAARAHELNYERIGLARATEADDLKDIVGVGPFFEKKLHSLGIFTFRQIANCTPADIQQIASILEYFPDRIERDDWVGQAQRLHRKKYTF